MLEVSACSGVGRVLATALSIACSKKVSDWFRVWRVARVGWTYGDGVVGGVENVLGRTGRGGSDPGGVVHDRHGVGHRPIATGGAVRVDDRANGNGQIALGVGQHSVSFAVAEPGGRLVRGLDDLHHGSVAHMNVNRS